jgi:hypothetical protein
MREDEPNTFELMQWDRSAADKTAAHPLGVFNQLAVLDPSHASLTENIEGGVWQSVLKLTLPSDQVDISSVGKKGVEVWMCGPDRKPKNAFTVQTSESKGSVTVLTCYGPEAYLRKRLTLVSNETKDYNTLQRSTSGVLEDITALARKDDIICRISVDPSLEMPLDIKLLWSDSLETSVKNILHQTGGYMRMRVDRDDPTCRVLELLPIGST